MPPGDVARSLERRARELKPTALFPGQDGKPIEYHRREQREIGAVEVRHLTLGQHLSYHSSTNHAGEKGCILGVRAEGDPYMFCFNLCDRAVTNYTEGLAISPYYPGEALLHPLSTVAAFAPPGALARFSSLFVTRDFMREIALATHLPGGQIQTEGPWVLTARMPTAVLQALAQIEGCPLRGGLRRLYVEAKALEIIALLLAHMHTGIGEPVETRRLRPRDVRRVCEARDILDSRLDDLPSLNEVAKAVGMSTTALKRAYRVVFGVPVYEYARNERLQRARILLAEGELSVGEVAARVGYQSLSWFSLVFKKKFGMLPREVWPCTVKELSSGDNAAP